MSWTDDTLEEVKLAPQEPADSHFFLENASTSSLVVSLLILSVFVVAHARTALRAPSVLAHKEEYYALSMSPRKGTADVDVTLTQLTPGHRFIRLNGSLVPKNASANFTIPVNISIRVQCLNDSIVTSADLPDAKSYADLVYIAGQNHTSFFPVAHVSTGDIDVFRVRTSLTFDFTKFAGFLFRWEFANADTESYERSSKVLTSFLIGYRLVLFVLYLKFDSESFTQLFLVLIGLSGFFVSYSQSSNHMFMSAFQALFRLFLLAQLEILRSHSTSPPAALLLGVGVVFAAYAALQAAAAADRQSHVMQAQSEVPVVLRSEFALIVVDGVFAAEALIYFVVAAIANEGVNPRRVAFVGLALLAVIGVTLLCEVFFVLTNRFMYSAMPRLLVSSTHVTLAALALFLMHTSRERHDATIDETKGDPGRIDFDERSDDDPGSEEDYKDEEDHEETCAEPLDGSRRHPLARSE
jgi:hypothetical protein